MVEIAGSVPAAVANATNLGPVDGGKQLSVLICFDFADPQAAQGYADAVSDPGSLLYGQWLTPQEVGQKFGPNPDVYGAMSTHIQANGLVMDELPVNRLTMRVSGTVAQLEQAFGVTLNNYREAAADAIRMRGADAVPYEFYAPATPVKIPGELAGKITSIEKMENYTRPIPLAKKAKRISSQFDAIQARTGYNLTPIYNALNATSNNKPGVGRTIGISNFDGFDVATNAPKFISRNGLPIPAAGAASNISVVIPSGSISSGTSGQLEGDLDFQAVLGQAPLATIIIYDSGTDNVNYFPDLIGVLSREASDNKADVLTESYGWALSPPTAAAAHTQHVTMTTQGQTYLTASGDNGNIQRGQGSPSRVYDYSDYEPEVLVIGGTILTVDGSNNFASEAGWTGSGGGYSTSTVFFNVLPTWQKGRAVPTLNKRLSPDISSHSAGAGGAAAYLIYYGGGLTGLSGTSCASPVDAGDFAVVEQYLISQSVLPANTKGKQRVGRINDKLYAFNGRSDIFHDTTGGTSNGAGTTVKYWDYVTGWGSVNWNNLAAALAAPLSVAVTAASPTVLAGHTTQLTATVTGSNVKTVTWKIVSGPGTLSTSGLYTAPASVTTAQAVVAQATSTIDTANAGTTSATIQPDPVFGQVTLNVVPATVSVFGTVTLQGVADPTLTVIPVNPVTFVFTPTAGGAATTVTQTLGAGGSFSISGLPAASYSLNIKGDKWLSATAAADGSAGDVTGISVSLLAADGNNDNSVDSSDFTLLIGAFNSNSALPGSGYVDKADFNNDGFVDSTDFTLLIGNFGQVGN